MLKPRHLDLIHPNYIWKYLKSSEELNSDLRWPKWKNKQTTSDLWVTDLVVF